MRTCIIMQMWLAAVEHRDLVGLLLERRQQHL
jgi:hypothetical protein